MPPDEETKVQWRIYLLVSTVSTLRCYITSDQENRIEVLLNYEIILFARVKDDKLHDTENKLIAYISSSKNLLEWTTKIRWRSSAKQ